MTVSDTTSTTLSGIGVSPGLVAGPVARMAPPIPEPEIATLEPSRDIEKECERIALAAQRVKKGLELSAAEAKAEARTLLETTAQMAADPTPTSTAPALGGDGVRGQDLGVELGQEAGGVLARVALGPDLGAFEQGGDDVEVVLGGLGQERSHRACRGQQGGGAPGASAGAMPSRSPVPSGVGAAVRSGLARENLICWRAWGG